MEANSKRQLCALIQNIIGIILMSTGPFFSRVTLSGLLFFGIGAILWRTELKTIRYGPDSDDEEDIQIHHATRDPNQYLPKEEKKRGRKN
jgi:hypothetical protein